MNPIIMIVVKKFTKAVISEAIKAYAAYEGSGSWLKPYQFAIPIRALFWISYQKGWYPEEN